MGKVGVGRIFAVLRKGLAALFDIRGARECARFLQYLR